MGPHIGRLQGQRAAQRLFPVADSKDPGRKELILAELPGTGAGTPEGRPRRASLGGPSPERTEQGTGRGLRLGGRAVPWCQSVARGHNLRPRAAQGLGRVSS